LWTEDHRPRRLSDIVGQDAAVSQMRGWAKSWGRGNAKRKALLLYGPAGTGKTTAALALGEEMGWDVVEVNASDNRSRTSLEELSRSVGTRYSLLSGVCLKLIILDEVDGLSGTQDRGGARVINKMIRVAINPVILTCNDYYSRKLRNTRRLAKGIEFKRPGTREIQSVLSDICRKEGIPVDLLALRTIAERSDGDLRSAINDLEALTVDGKLSRESIRTPASRKSETYIYRVLDLIFRGDPDALREARDLDMTPDELLRWIAENVHFRFRDPRERANAYEMLSMADIYLSWVGREMHWGFWGYATEMMTRGLGSLMGNRLSPFRRNYRYKYPSTYLRHRVMTRSIERAGDEETRSRGELGDELEVARLIGKRCHMSANSAYKEFLPYLRIIQENDPEMAEALLRSTGVSEDELCELPYG